MTEATAKNTINLYACGGAGISIATQFSQPGFAAGTNTGFAAINTFFVDTSKSDLPSSASKANTHIFTDSHGKELDGSGKTRALNLNIIRESIADVLYKFKPSESLNIVISSGSGGSGSIVAPLIVDELLKAGKNVVVLCVGTTTSLIETTNTIKTLRSYDNFARESGKPVIMHYLENSITLDKQSVDRYMQGMIVTLSMIFSGLIRKLDSADLKNLLNYTSVSSFPAQLSLCRIVSDMNDDIGTTMVSAATIISDEDALADDLNVSYHTYGIITAEAKKSISVSTPLHLGIYLGYFAKVIERLSGREADLVSKAGLFKDRPMGTKGGMEV